MTVHGLTAPDFLVPRTQSAARRELGVPTDGPLVLVSGGGWGVGDIIGAVEVASSSAQVAQIVCLCGRNEALRRRLTERFGQDPRVRVEGFTDRMAAWMAAADVLIHSTGGLTVLEAMMRGLPTISYGWGRGHIRLNNAAFRRFGLAEVVAEPDRAGSGNRESSRTWQNADGLVREVALGRIGRRRLGRMAETQAP